MRKTIIAGNWKMNMTPSGTKALIEEMKKTLPADPSCKVVLCVPYVDIAAAKEAADGSVIAIGAENVHFEPKGAYTGEISAEMLVECGVEYVIVGHSERRQYFGETDETVNLRAKAAVNAGLNAIICVGETLLQRDQNVTAEVVARQTKIALLGFDKEMMKKVVVAYEPVWAIGTGRNATSDQAQEVCALIREVIAGLYDKETANDVTVQYGGSMNAKNAAELLAKPDVDGGLIGGASLKAPDFATIVSAAK
ncbi:MAG: triose-phosphate isomerase [Clostridia bacterium]|nr:triose-phosphate isomerase [Clostridia bacterium]